jgi:hypothetical protein
MAMERGLSADRAQGQARGTRSTMLILISILTTLMRTSKREAKEALLKATSTRSRKRNQSEDTLLTRMLKTVTDTLPVSHQAAPMN